MKNIFAVLVFSTFSIAHGAGTINAAVMKFTVYKMAVSTSASCTSPVTIFTNSSGVEQDMVAGANFGSGRVDPGTYPCVMIEMSKIIKTRASTSSGSCNSAIEFQDVICNDGGQLSQTIAGSPVTCSGGITNDQHVTLFITTLSAGSSGNRSLLPPLNGSDTTSGLALSGAFVVSTSKAGALSVNYHNFLDGSGGVCSTSAPGFSFN